VEDLSRYDFRIDANDRYKAGTFNRNVNIYKNSDSNTLIGCYLTSTYVLEDSKRQFQWLFEESFVDSSHVAAVCREVKELWQFFIINKIQKNVPQSCRFSEEDEKLFFTKVDFNFLLQDSSILNPLINDAADEFNNYMQKPRKRF